MSFVHGKSVFVSLDGSDISAFCTSVGPKRTADTHDVTTFGKNSKVYFGGLLDGTFDVEGIYDNTASGPKAVIEPLLGTTVTMIYRPEGTGSGKPQTTVDVLISSYEETSAGGRHGHLEGQPAGLRRRDRLRPGLSFSLHRTKGPAEA
jgi:hypothetical protein